MHVKESTLRLFCTGLSLLVSSVVAGPALVVLTIARCLSAVTAGKLKRYEFITYKTWEFHSTPGPT